MSAYRPSQLLRATPGSARLFGTYLYALRNRVTAFPFPTRNRKLFLGSLPVRTTELTGGGSMPARMHRTSFPDCKELIRRVYRPLRGMTKGNCGGGVRMMADAGGLTEEAAKFVASCFHELGDGCAHWITRLRGASEAYCGRERRYAFVVFPLDLSCGDQSARPIEPNGCGAQAADLVCVPSGCPSRFNGWTLLGGVQSARPGLRQNVESGAGVGLLARGEESHIVIKSERKGINRDADPATLASCLP